jgi:hypothetical protein
MMTSKFYGKLRYQTNELRRIIDELEEAEENLKNTLIPFLKKMFGKFFETRELFTRAI